MKARYLVLACALLCAGCVTVPLHDTKVGQFIADTIGDIPVPFFLATNTVPEPPNPPNPPQPSIVAEWPAYPALQFFEHGYSEEDAYRIACLNAAQAAGLNALKVLCPGAPGDELAMHLLHLASPVDGHYMQGSWYDKAQAQGISRYVLDIGNGAELGRWKFLVKDYPANSIQWIIDGKVVAQ